MSDEVLREIEDLECETNTDLAIEGLARIAREEHERAEAEFRVASEMCERAEKAEGEALKHQTCANGFSGELAKTEAENSRLREALTRLVQDCDGWTQSVESIIGRQPRQEWPALYEARAALRGAKE